MLHHALSCQMLQCFMSLCPMHVHAMQCKCNVHAMQCKSMSNFQPMLHHVPHSSEEFSALKARLSDLAHAYCGNPIDIGDFLILKECIQATRSLRCNENIHVTTPDKDSGVVIMNKSDYISKMDFILQDNSKFENLGPSSEFDNTAKIEAHIQRRLLQLKKEGLLPSDIYRRIRPTGSQRPQMYGLPKIHKQDVPLRPIL